MSISNALSLVVATPSSSATPTPTACLKVVKEIGRELVVELPSGEQVSISTDRINKLFGFASRSGCRVRCVKSAEDLTSLHLALCKAISLGSSALVQVSKATTGKTERSRKVRVDGVAHRPHAPFDPPVTKSHTVTVPAMHIHTQGDKCYVPRWVLKRAIHKNVLGGKSWPDRIDGGVWFGAEMLWQQLFVPMEQELARQLDEQAKRAAIRAVEYEKRAAQDRERAVIAKAQDDAAKVAKAVAQAKSDARKAKLETLHVDQVEWDTWVNKKGGYMEKVTRTADNCTLRFSGARVYIQFEDGDEIIKTRSTVRWHVAADE